MGIKNILICSIHGIPVMNHIVDDPCIDLDDDLMMGLLSAIKTFTNSSIKQELELVETTEFRFIILPSIINELVFIIISDYDCDKDLGHTILEDIRDPVIENYRRQLMGNAVTGVSKSVRDGISKIIDGILSNYKIIKKIS